jgi:hypothetical protein
MNRKVAINFKAPKKELNTDRLLCNLNITVARNALSGIKLIAGGGAFTEHIARNK